MKRTHATTEAAIAERQEHLKLHASRVIATHGIDGCSLSAVAAAARCSIGMVQHHFGTRDALILAAIEYRAETAEREWQQICATPNTPLGTIRDLLQFAVEGERSFADAWGFWAQIFAAAPRNEVVRDTARRTLAVWQSLFVDAIAAGRDAGDIPTHVDPVTAARFVVAATDGFAMQALGGIQDMTPQSMHEQLVSLTAFLLDVKEPLLCTDPSLATVSGASRP